MKHSIGTILILLVAFANNSWWLPAPLPRCSAKQTKEVWGLYGHRKINHHAVFSLPPDMMLFFKPNIDYLTEHATDADTRRRASKHEAPRHYLDLDRYGEPPFVNLPRDWTDALLCHSNFFFLRQNADTLPLFDQPLLAAWAGPDTLIKLHPATGASPQKVGYQQLRSFFNNVVLPLYYEDSWLFSADAFAQETGVSIPGGGTIMVLDTFSEHGILPYHLQNMMDRLTTAFRLGSADLVLRYAADIGHYVADAHVPLHTTANYNGQLSNQLGIHAFWESRLPELFADQTYDLWVGKATYIANKREYFWNIVLESFSLVDSVLSVEQQLSRQFTADQRYCTEWRGNSSVTLPCEAYARAYHARLGGMVERRMRQAILAVSSVWYTCWIDAGQPDLRPLLGTSLPAELLGPPDSIRQAAQPLRPHEGR